MWATRIYVTCYAFRHGGKLKSQASYSLHRFVSMWISLTAGFMASQYDSDLLGFLTVVALYSCIGFHVASYGLCFAVGFAVLLLSCLRIFQCHLF